MTEDTSVETDRLTPDDAFALLGDGTRVAILRELGGVEEPLRFSALRERVDVDDSSRFNYHLDRMVGHFVARTDEGYRLAPAGRRVVEAVLSGVVTERPDLPATEVDEPCQYCGAPVEVGYEEGAVELYCTSCSGRYGRTFRADDAERSMEGYLGRYPLPPAGTRDRSPGEVLRAAWTWGNLEILSLATGICPRCSAPVEWDATLCESHDAAGGICPDCDRRNALAVFVDCTNCILSTGGDPVVALAANTDLLALLTADGRNPVAPAPVGRVEAVHSGYEETIVSEDPLRARYTFSVGGEDLSLTVDGDLSVVESTRGNGT